MTRAFAPTLILALALAAGVAAAAPSTTDPAKVPAGDYVLDKRHASLTVKIAHMGGFSHFTMRFDGLDGDFTYDPANWQSTKVTINIDPKSIDTGNPPFDKQITGYFEPDKYPAFNFVSTGVQAGPDGVGGAKGAVTGDLTFHGVTKPVTLDVTFNGEGPGISPLGARLGFSGVAHIKRTDFNLDSMILKRFASDDLDVIFEVEFEKK